MPEDSRRDLHEDLTAVKISVGGGRGPDSIAVCILLRLSTLKGNQVWQSRIVGIADAGTKCHAKEFAESD